MEFLAVFQNFFSEDKFDGAAGLGKGCEGKTPQLKTGPRVKTGALGAIVSDIRFHEKR